MLKTKYHITQYCHIRNNAISLNGTTLFTGDFEDFSKFIKAAYKDLNIDYSKFFKMDDLSKLALIAGDVLLHKEIEKNIALVFSNSASSIDTDKKHQAVLKEYPSPAVFVYTLPNICLGEISIKHQLFSENSFFISNNFNASTLYHYTNSLLDEKKAEKVLCGWVNFDDGKYDAFLYIVANKGTFVHTETEINRIYLS